MNDTKRKAASERTVTVVPMAAPLPRRKRVAAYARVSVEKDSMLHSLAAQVSYYNGLIRKHSEWEYVNAFTESDKNTREYSYAFSGSNKNTREYSYTIADGDKISR